MSNNCVFSQLLAESENQKLPEFGSFDIKVQCNGQKIPFNTGQGGINGTNIQIKIIDGYLCTSDGTLIGDGHNYTSITSDLSNDINIYGEDEVIIRVIDNYYLTHFGISGLSQIDIDLNVFKFREHLVKLVMYLVSIKKTDIDFIDILNTNPRLTRYTCTPPYNLNPQLNNIEKLNYSFGSNSDGSTNQGRIYVPPFSGSLENYILHLVNDCGYSAATFSFKCYLTASNPLLYENLNITFNGVILNPYANSNIDISVENTQSSIVVSNVYKDATTRITGTYNKTSHQWNYTEVTI